MTLIVKENFKLKQQLLLYQNTSSSRRHRWRCRPSSQLLGPFSYDPRLATMLISSGGVFFMYPLVYLVERAVGYNYFRLVLNFAYVYGLSEFLKRYVYTESFIYVIPVLGWVCGQYDNFPYLQTQLPFLSALSAIGMMYVSCMVLETAQTNFLYLGTIFIVKRLVPKPDLSNLVSPSAYFSLIAAPFVIMYMLRHLSLGDDRNTRTYTMSMFFLSDFGWRSHVDYSQDHVILFGVRYGVLLTIGWTFICLCFNIIHKLVVANYLLGVSFFLNLVENE